VVHSLKALDPKRPIREADKLLQCRECPLCARNGHRNAKAVITDTGLLSIREIIERYE